MVVLQKRSIGTLKPKRSSFDAWGGRNTALGTSMTCLNRPIPPPPVVEDVVPGMSVPNQETQSHRPRRIRFFGLSLKLPFLGSKDKSGQGKGDGWRHCQTTSDSSGDERTLMRHRVKVAAQLSNQGSSQVGEASNNGCFESDGYDPGSQSFNSLQLLPLDGSGPEDYSRNAQSLDMGVTDPPTMPWQLRRKSTLARVEECYSPMSASPAPVAPDFVETKMKWTQRASRRVVSMATRFSRKSKDRQSAARKPVLERNSASLPLGRQSKMQPDLDRRKSIGSFMGGRPDAYDTPGPEGPRCPPDNVFIPSGPPDTIYIQSSNTDQQMGLDSPGPFLATAIAAAYPAPCSNSAMSYRSRWSTDSGLVQPGQWTHLGNDEATRNSSMEAECEEYYGPCRSEARRSIHLERSTRRRRSIEAADPWTFSQISMSRRKGACDRSMDSGVRSPVTSPTRVQPAGWAYESQEDMLDEQDGNCISDRDLNGQKPVRNMIPHPAHRDHSNACAPRRSSGGLSQSFRAKLSFDSRRSFRTMTPGARGSFEAEAADRPAVQEAVDHRAELSHRDEQEEVASRQDSLLFDSMESFDDQHTDEDVEGDAMSYEGEDLDADGVQDDRPPQRASLSLSEPQKSRPINKTRAPASPVRWAQHPSNRIDLCMSCASDGPLYHRSVFFENGFSSAEDSDDDLDGCERFTPTQFMLKMKPTHHQRWHSDFFDGTTVFRDGDFDGYSSPMQYRLDRGDQLNELPSDYSEGYFDYPDEPGFSLRTGSDSDFVLPEFEDIEERSMDRHRRSLDGEKHKKTWLDELQECAELRRKECTYRIACQRAIMQSMKETVQASKLAFERLKSGLCPQATAKVPELRRRWGGRRRAVRREKIVMAAKRNDEELWEDIPLATSACGLLHLCP